MSQSTVTLCGHFYRHLVSGDCKIPLDVICAVLNAAVLLLQSYEPVATFYSLSSTHDHPLISRKVPVCNSVMVL